LVLPAPDPVEVAEIDQTGEVETAIEVRPVR